MSGAGAVAAISGAGAGYEYPTEEVSWLKRDVLLFANSIGCTVDELYFLYVCPDLSGTAILWLTISHSGTASEILCVSYLLHHPA